MMNTNARPFVSIMICIRLRLLAITHTYKHTHNISVFISILYPPPVYPFPFCLFFLSRESDRLPIRLQNRFLFFLSNCAC